MNARRGASIAHASASILMRGGNMNRCLRLGALVVLATLVPAAALAQSFRGTILGTVKDRSGAVLPGVSITVTNTGTNISRTAVTNETGDFVIPELIVGVYSLAAELPGFKKEVLTGLEVKVDQRLRSDVRMEIG